MSWFRRTIFRLQAVFIRRKIEEALDEEIKAHLEMSVAAHRATGRSEEEARSAAYAEFGGVAQMKERYRDERGISWIEGVLQDLRGILLLRKSPGYVVVALATVALGVGVNTTAFSVLDRLLFQSLPFRDTARLVQIYAAPQGFGLNPVTPGDYLDLRDQNTVFESMAAFNPTPLWSYSEPGRPAVKCFCVVETANFLPLIGIEPQIGRHFTDAEQKHYDRLVLLSNAFWRDRYNSDPNAIGQTILLNSKPYTIVGVLPVTMDNAALFGTKPDFFPLDNTEVNRGYRTKGWYHVAARLKPGATLQQAQAELNVLAERLSEDHPDSNRYLRFNVTPYPTTSVSAYESHLVELVSALSALILVIACVNLANLQLIRTTRRLPELAVRRALGCSKWRLLRMLLAESLFVAVAGGIIGTFVAYWGNTVVAHFLNYDLPVDGRVVAFTFSVSALAGLLFGLGPALLASKADAATALRVGVHTATIDPSKRLMRRILVVVEIGLATTVLTGAGFFVTSVYRYMHEDLGWRTDHLVVGYLALSHDKYGEEGDPRSLLFVERFREELMATPGVVAATVSRLSPLFGFNWEPFTVEDGPPPEPGRIPFAEFDYTSPGFFDTYGVKLIAGRDFSQTDRPGSPSVVIVNETLANKYWPDQNPLGKRIATGDPHHPNWSEVVGVMKTFRTRAANIPDAGHFQYLRPWAQSSFRFFSFSVKTDGPAGIAKGAVSKVITRLDPAVAPFSLRTGDEAIESAVSLLVFVRQVLLLVSALGLLLASIGLYGIIANVVAERTREIGIRIALGAQPAKLVWHFLRDGIVLAFAGMLIGVIGSMELFQFLTKLYPGFKGDNPRIVAAVALLLFVVAIVASWIPSWRAAKVDPIKALRTE